MARTLDPTHLRSLVAIADAGGFLRAAATLHVSQSTVSQHVRHLERTVGAPLVEKHGRATRFTAAGEQMLAEARHILAVHDEVLARLEARPGVALTIGATETVAEQLLPAVLADMRDAFPDRTVQFVIDRSTQMLQKVDQGEIDVAVLLVSAGQVNVRIVGEFELGWYSAPAWSVPGGDSGCALVAYTEPCGMRQRAMGALGVAGVPVTVTAESTSLEGVMAAARAGLGVAVLPTAGATPHGLVRRLDLPALGSIGVAVAARQGIEASVAARAEAAVTGVLATVAGGPSTASV